MCFTQMERLRDKDRISKLTMASLVSRSIAKLRSKERVDRVVEAAA